MAKRVLNVGNPYRIFPHDIFRIGLASLLPQAYRKFYYEWKEPKTPVHYNPRGGRYVRNKETGIVSPVQNIPLPLRYPNEFDECLLGGEALVQGYYKSKPRVKKFPHFWIPTLTKTVVYSEILNKHMEVLATNRLIQLINHYKGFDEYIMQTKANDLQTKLALAFKREMIKAIHAGLPGWADEPDEQKELLNRYKKYGDQYTAEEADWYGYTILDATTRLKEIMAAEEEAKIVPLKHEFRRKLIEDLKAAGLENVERIVRTEQGKIVDLSAEGEKKSWISKLNPFSKK